MSFVGRDQQRSWQDVRNYIYFISESKISYHVAAASLSLSSLESTNVSKVGHKTCAVVLPLVRLPDMFWCPLLSVS